MTFSASHNLDRFTECHPTLSENGSKLSDCETSRASPLLKPSMTSTCPSDQAHSREHSFTFGTDQEQQHYSMACAIHGPFTVTSNGSIGQMILDADGDTLAWATNPLVAQLICKLMTDYTNNENRGT